MANNSNDLPSLSLLKDEGMHLLPKMCILCINYMCFTSMIYKMKQK